MKKIKSPYHGFRFPGAVISCTVRWYHRFNLSLRDIEQLLLERGVRVTYESVGLWCEWFGAQFAHRANAARGRPGATWHLDEAFVKLRGVPYFLWRAVDEHGMELDVLLRKRRNKAAAKRCFRRVLRSNPVPQKIVTDQLRSYPAAKAEVPELADVRHVFVKACGRVNDRAENSHQPTRRSERQMQGFREPRRALAFLSPFEPIRQQFALPRHRMRATAQKPIGSGPTARHWAFDCTLSAPPIKLFAFLIIACAPQMQAVSELARSLSGQHMMERKVVNLLQSALVRILLRRFRRSVKWLQCAAQAGTQRNRAAPRPRVRLDDATD